MGGDFVEIVREIEIKQRRSEKSNQELKSSGVR